MNKIEAQIGKSKYVQEPHLLFVIDGDPLDEILAMRSQNDSFRGLIPTTLGWLDNPIEQQEVWKRFAKRETGEVLLPILCCPDDLDFCCIVVVVLAIFKPYKVKWLKFGIDTTPSENLTSA